MSENMDGVMRRIQKLLAIANDDRADPNEAAAAGAMAEKIMRKYQLEHADLLTAQLNSGEGMDMTQVVVTAKTNGTKVKSTPLWAQWIATRIGKLNEVNVMMGVLKGEQCINFAGFKSDTQVAAWTLEYLCATVNRLCTAYRTNPVYLEHGRSAMHTYRQGVTLAICMNIEGAIAAKNREAAQATGVDGNTGRALVLAQAKAQAVAKFFGEQQYGKSKTKPVSEQNASAFADGWRDGKKVDVGRQAIGTTQAEETLKLAGG